MSINWAELAKEHGIGNDDTMVIDGVTFRKIPEAPMYYMDMDGRVYSKYIQRLMKPSPKGDIAVRDINGKMIRRGIHIFRNAVWDIDSLPEKKPEQSNGLTIIKSGRSYYIDNVEYRKIPHFPNYIMNRKGEVISIRTYRRIKPFIPKYERNRYYSVRPRGQVNISHNGQQKSLNVNTLIKKIYGAKAVYDE